MRLKSNNIGKKLKQLTLFTKIVLVILSSLIISTVLVTTVIIKTGEKLYNDTYSTSNLKIGDRIEDEFKNLNYKAYNLIAEYSRNNKLKKFCTEYISETNRFHKQYSLQNELFHVNGTYGSSYFNILVIGSNTNYYVDNYIGVSSETVDDIMVMEFYSKYKNDLRISYNYLNCGFNGYASSCPSVVISKGLIDPINHNIFGDIFISIKEEEFSNIYGKYLTKGNDVIILAKDGQVLSSSIKKYIGEKHEDVLDFVKESIKSSEYIQTPLEEKNYLLMARYIPDTDFYLVMLNDKSIVNKTYSKAKYQIIMFSIIIALITCSIVLLITRRTTSHLIRLVNTMEAATETDFKEKVSVDGGYEVRRLSMAYNQMVLELEKYIDKLIQEQEQRRLAELSALQMQINPHFMYNTLASIKYLAWQGDTKAVDEMINAFIALLQNTISKTDEMVTIREEIDNLKKYAKINSMRYGEKIQVTYYIDEDAMDLYIPKLILQPIVENAFFHAFSNKDRGEIKIFVSLINNQLTCEIIDNGDGIKTFPSTKANERTNFKTYSKGIGLDNIRERLQVVYGENAKLLVHSTTNVGTSVKIVIIK